ncbi:hypothetical protein [Bacillus sp. Marseille-Q7846]
MTGRVKRLKISDKVLRNLYVYSGNQCAFPGCSNEIVDENGTYIAQVCHIEAASKGGQRFNPDMTNKERRDFSNLILLCYEHHKVTDDEAIYTVEKMKEMKANHEAKFKNIIEDMSNLFIEDITKNQSIIYPISLNSINDELKWRNNEEELQQALEVMIVEVQKLVKITPATRSVFLTMLERSEGNIVLLNEIPDILNLSNKKMEKHMDLLIKYSLIDKPEESFEYRGYISEFNTVEGWPMWEDIKKYCEVTDIDLKEIVYDLKFDLLD